MDKVREQSMPGASKALCLLVLSLVIMMSSSISKDTVDARVDRTATTIVNLNLTLPGDLPTNLTTFESSSSPSQLVGLFLGSGGQEYTYNGTTWINSNVSAILVNNRGEPVARHFFRSPADQGGGVATWEYTAGPYLTSVTAKALVKIPQQAAVPLVLLEATSNIGHSNDLFGFSEVTHVQRLETSAGLPPDTTAPTGTLFYSPYSALYAFYVQET